MSRYRVRAYRKQLVEVLIDADDWEQAWDMALDSKDWDVVETFDVEDNSSVSEVETCDPLNPKDPDYWHDIGRFQ
jgi:hypothetical protein